MIMDTDIYLDLKAKVIEAGYAAEVDWAEGLKPVEDSWEFFCEYVWVVINAGMREQVARKIFDRIMDELEKGGSETLDHAFGNKAKVMAIQDMLANLTDTFEKYRALETDDGRLRFLEGLHFIGSVTKYHLAKNLGMTTVCKPDRHLVRIAGESSTTPQAMCDGISQVTGDSVALVDQVIWRAANLGMI
jgi:hypothetical protein